MTIDPGLTISMRAGFVLLFGVATLHKLIDFRAFHMTVASYLRDTLLERPAATRTLAFAVLLAEASVITACAGAASAPVAGLVTASLLLAYAAAMYANVLRGNVLLDCGCSWGRSRQPVSRRLVLRNVLLAVAAVSLLLPVGSRALGVLDVVSIVAAVVVAALLYSSMNQLLSVPSVSREVR